MKAEIFSVELEGRKVLVDRTSQEVSVLDASGNVLSRERIQVAAGSIQGIFSSLEGVAGVLAPGSTHRNI